MCARRGVVDAAVASAPVAPVGRVQTVSDADFEALDRVIQSFIVATD